MSRLRVPRIALLLLLLTAFTACDYVERASVDSSGGDPRGASLDPSISANGRYGVFWSPADDLVAGDGNGVNDVFRRDLLTDTTTRVSVDAGGGDLVREDRNVEGGEAGRADQHDGGDRQDEDAHRDDAAAVEEIQCGGVRRSR